MHRFFVDPSQIENNKIQIIGDDIAHIKVLRIDHEEIIEICDGNGNDYHCLIESESKNEILCRIIDRQSSAGENDYHVTLFQGVPKKSKFEEIIQKNIECGVNDIVPFISSRTIKKGNDNAGQYERYKKIAYAAAKQSKRGTIPQIHPTDNINDIIKRVKDYDCFIIAYEKENTVLLSDALKEAKDPKNIAVMIGPEGGLAEEEVNALTKAGAVSVSLGHRILRTETAGMTVMSQINFYFEIAGKS